MSNTHKFKLIIGLGNPDEQYQNTFHNAGSIAIDYFIKKINGKAVKPEEWNSGAKTFTYFKVGKIIFIKPTVYMNDSGKAIAEAIKYFSKSPNPLLKRGQGELRPEEILIIHDDIDIELGNFKLSFNKNSAGHKGIESIMRALKTKEFWRLRIGIGRKRKTKQAMDVVLSKIGKADAEKINAAIKESFKSLELI